jgi:hypothetical protein
LIGIADYASSEKSVITNNNNNNSTDSPQPNPLNPLNPMGTPKMFSNFDIQPTFSHFAITSLFNAG